MAGPEKFKTYNNVFDAFTERNLFKLASQGFFEELEFQISLGKEANVFAARTKEGGLVAVKIYRLQNCNFNAMWSYLASDPRYNGVKPQKRQIIFAWTQREFRNLLKSRDAGVRVPTPIHCMHNIIIEECLLEGDGIAPQLKKYPVEDPQAMYTDIKKNMRLLYHDAKLVHADLSSFNILVTHNTPVIIDMSQATNVQDPQAEEYLRRDVRNIVQFFSRLGVECTEQELYDEIVAK